MSLEAAVRAAFAGWLDGLALPGAPTVLVTEPAPGVPPALPTLALLVRRVTEVAAQPTAVGRCDGRGVWLDGECEADATLEWRGTSHDAAVAFLDAFRARVRSAAAMSGQPVTRLGATYLGQPIQIRIYPAATYHVVQPEPEETALRGLWRMLLDVRVAYPLVYAEPAATPDMDVRVILDGQPTLPADPSSFRPEA